MGLSEDLERTAGIARTHAGPEEELAAVIAAEPSQGLRVYVCAFRAAGGQRWLALDSDGAPVTDRQLVRDAVSIAAMCEIAEDTAGGGNLGALRARLAEIRETEGPGRVEEAEEATAALVGTIGTAPRVASPVYLDEIGAATRRLEQALGDAARSPFSEAMKRALGNVEELKLDVEASYKRPLA